MKLPRPLGAGVRVGQLMFVGGEGCRWRRSERSFKGPRLRCRGRHSSRRRESKQGQSFTPARYLSKVTASADSVPNCRHKYQTGLTGAARSLLVHKVPFGLGVKVCGRRRTLIDQDRR